MQPDNELEAWRRQARALLIEQTPPAHAHWPAADTGGLAFTDGGGPMEHDKQPRNKSAHRVSPAFLALAERVLCHTDPERHSLLYEALWRLTGGESHLFELAHDPLVRRLELYDRAVRRDIHKTHAFVRFQPVSGEDGTRRFIAWFEPRFSIIRLVAEFFVARFTSMHWALLTPQGCVEWDRETLRFSGGIPKPAHANDDPISDAWKVYYRSIFNPARLHLQAMRREMPSFYWKNLPEAAQIGQLIRAAGPRVDAMLRFAPGPRGRSVARHASQRAANPQTNTAAAPTSAQELRECRLCPHAAAATQAVAGEGPLTARIMLVGEQPGDLEDLEGRPFVGPTGEVLDRALATAGLSRRDLYLTNAVKHFSWQLRGKRRLHKTPSQQAIDACRTHLLRELDRVRPRVIVCLGQSAVKSLTHGTGIQLERGVPMKLSDGRYLLATLHPAYILRSGLAGPQALEALANHLALARSLAAGPILATSVK